MIRESKKEEQQDNTLVKRLWERTFKDSMNVVGSALHSK